MLIAERVLEGARSADHIPRNIARLRNLFRLSDSELARLAGIKRPTLVNKLAGRGQFSAEELGRLAAVWGMGVDRLYQHPTDMKQWINDHEDELEASIRNRCFSDLWSAPAFACSA
jgi:transcriptional regulator with XRE-family HTH domain